MYHLIVYRQTMLIGFRGLTKGCLSMGAERKQLKIEIATFNNVENTETENLRYNFLSATKYGKTT